MDNEIMEYNNLTDRGKHKFRTIFLEGIIKGLDAGKLKIMPKANDFVHTFFIEMNPMVPIEWEKSIKEAR